MLFADIETDKIQDDGFTVSKIHCIDIYEDGEHTLYDPESEPIEAGVERIQNAPYVVFHNGIGFDIPALSMLYPWFEYKGQVIDTLLWSRLAFPMIKETDFGRWRKGTLPGQLIGRYSLESWGYRLGVLKGDYGKQQDAWDKWTPEMSEYCKQDVTVMVKLYEVLANKNVSKDALQLEHAVAHIIERQRRMGVVFDMAKAEQFHVCVKSAHNYLLEKLQEHFPPFYVKAQKKVFIPKRDNKRLGYRTGAACTKIKLVDFNPGSNQHLAQVLKKKYGWEPTEYTEKSGEPVINETILERLAEKWPVCDLIKEYWTVDKRLSQLAEAKGAWMKNFNPETKRIHGSVNTLGTRTRRMSHFNPNMAQVPAGYSPYGEQCRELFTVPNTSQFRLVGCDANSIEMRLLAHFLFPYDKGKFAEAVLKGSKAEGTDPHTMNMKALGIDSRDTAKTWFYAFMYGAGLMKLAIILGCSVKQSGKYKKQFLKNIQGFEELVNGVQAAAKQRKWLKSLDGSKLPAPSPHSALNTLIQGAGGVLMKRALVIADSKLVNEHNFRPAWYNFKYSDNYDYEWVLNVHDELQSETLKEKAEVVGEVIKESIKEAGEYYNLRVPMDGDYDIGLTWNETH
jgi:DNA polymerase I-like protein with 3'-5' exonuclease and polymerase domains